jgi:hypothetical protein
MTVATPKITPSKVRNDRSLCDLIDENASLKDSRNDTSYSIPPFSQSRAYYESPRILFFVIRPLLARRQQRPGNREFGRFSAISIHLDPKSTKNDSKKQLFLVIRELFYGELLAISTGPQLVSNPPPNSKLCVEDCYGVFHNLFHRGAENLSTSGGKIGSV